MACVNKTLAIVHTTPSTIGNLSKLCAELLPGVEVFHFLDDSLLKQINREGCISCDVRRRFFSLLSQAAAARPCVLMLACSSVGDILEQARPLYEFPLVRIDEPMAELAASRPGKITVCATLDSTLAPTVNLLRKKVGNEREIECVVVRNAGILLGEGKMQAYLDSVAQALMAAAQESQTVVLAQASMAQAVAQLPQNFAQKFLTSPESGIAALRKYFD